MTFTSSCIQFFSGRPQIASRIEVFGLDNVEMEDMRELDRLLESLPSLKTLVLGDVITQDGLDINEDAEGQGEKVMSNLIRTCASHAVDLLTYQLGEHHEPLVQCASFVRALALFARIGELSTRVVDTEEAEGEWPTEELVDMFVKHTVNAHWQNGTSSSDVAPLIMKLRCWGESVCGFFIPTYLLRLGALRDLTHLTYTLTYDTEWRWFFEIVLATHSTLTNLSVEISTFTANGAYALSNNMRRCS